MNRTPTQLNRLRLHPNWLKNQKPKSPCSGSGCLGPFNGVLSLNIRISLIQLIDCEKTEKLRKTAKFLLC
ncbi:hypothetical protein J22TS3_20450 [Paenibacillus sp. J22TS3]|nr:hypothetical protein J22TS3_20450 [Paenibacillus sp. J22TS3]